VKATLKAAGRRVAATGGRVAVVLFSRSVVTSLLDLAGAGLVVAGIALVFVPAAFFAAGVALLAMSYGLTGAQRGRAVRE
jgi:hypothetical protein